MRQPIEVFPLAEPRDGHRYGLLTGFRRLHAFRDLHAATGEPRYAAIPAFLRAPASLASALAAMVEENEIRADLSTYERGRIAVAAHDAGVFGTLDAAVEALYPNASRMKRARLRQLASLAEEMDGQLTAPEKLSLRQALRLADALRMGFGETIRAALAEARLREPESQWRLIEPILAESEETRRADPTPRPGRPRRVAAPRPGLTIRREKTRDGYSLHFTGREATSDLLDVVFDEIERMFGPADHR